LIERQGEYNRIFFQRAHNEFIQTAVENGIIGLLIFISFFAAAIYALLKSKLERTLKIIFSFAIIGFIVIANFSFPLERVELLILLFLFIIPGASVKERPKIKRSHQKVLLFSFLLLTIVFTFSWLNSELTLFKFKATGEKHFMEEMDKDYYSIDPTSTPTYWYAGNAFYENQNYKKAIGNYKKSLCYNPYHVHALNNLASSYFAIGQIDSAKYYYRKALKINPIFVESLMNHASISFNTGDIDIALKFIQRVPTNAEPENYGNFVQTIVRRKIRLLSQLTTDSRYRDFLLKILENEAAVNHIFIKSKDSLSPFEKVIQLYYKNFEKK